MDPSLSPMHLEYTIKSSFGLQGYNYGRTRPPVFSPNSTSCLLCTIKLHLAIIQVAADIWKAEGEPDQPISEDGGLPPSYLQAWKSWQGHKMILVKYMWELELCAEKKIMWEAEHPGVFESLSEVKSCKSAFAMAKMNMPFCKLIDIDCE